MASSSARPIDLTLGVGGERRLPLTSAGSVGYAWHVAADGDAATARVVSERATEAGMTGSANLFLQVVGVHPGSCRFDLTLDRTPGTPPRESLAVIVTVTP